ncbi:MAG: DNA polymerase II large subunit [Candidatus Bathyarchaeia archaeon]
MTIHLTTLQGQPTAQFKMSQAYEAYFSSIARELNRLYEVARLARSRGLDPKPEPEPRITRDLAEKVELLVGPPGVAARIRELSKVMEREEMAFKVGEEIVYGAFGPLEERAAAEQAIRTALAITTEGATVAPLQGITRVAFKQNADKSRYLSVYFAGPIRPAGGTEQALIVVVADFIRRKLRLDRYRPTEDEIRRFIEETRLYERSVRPLQYHVPDEVLDRILRNLPIEVTGVETDPFEVTSFRNLPRVETNRIRGGAIIVVNDGLAGRSRKVLKIVEKLGIEGWDWLETVWQAGQASGKSTDAMYVEEVIAGRPVFASPSRPGGFRLRYGRARNTGLAALGVHPATVAVLRDFLAVGTQLRVEKPSKGGVVACVDSIEPPVVRLKDGSVVRVETVEQAARLRPEIERVLFLGDLLVSFYDFLRNNRRLLPSGITEEEWAQRLKASLGQGEADSVKQALQAGWLSPSRLDALVNDPLHTRPTPREALWLSETLGVPLHPRYTYEWSRLSGLDLEELRRWLSSGQASIEGEQAEELRVPLDRQAKRLLERLLVPHTVENGRVVIREDAEILRRLLRLGASELRVEPGLSGLEAVRRLSGLRVEEKSPTFIGAKMGRPEKAKRREMKPLVHVLFPVGLSGGSKRDLIEASTGTRVSVELAAMRCPSCGSLGFRPYCVKCGAATVLEPTCPRCNRSYAAKAETCPSCGVQLRGWRPQTVDVKQLMDEASSRLGIVRGELVKGVKGLSSRSKVPEPLEKGLLRARFSLSVFKDGTVRFDATNAPLTHFKPKEIGTSIEELRQLGYVTDQHGAPLTDPEQVCELKVQDIIVPRPCLAYLARSAAFMDELLRGFYGLHPFYNARSDRDIVGQLVIGLAPHTSVGVVGRVIGFTDANVCFAHPYWHAAKRRDCDGDEDAVFLALDCFVNFSREYLPSQVGGLMDAPLLVTPILNPYEVDSAAHNLDVAAAYPTAFYEACREQEDPRQLVGVVDVVSERLGTEAQFEGFRFTHESSNICGCNLESAYKRLGTMKSKVEAVLLLTDQLEAVDAREVVEKVVSSHFIRDMMGNLRAFSGQRFRCKRCNSTHRRAPLTGKCARCGAELGLTVYRKSVEKYVEIAEEMAEKYEVAQYYRQRLALIRDEIEASFGASPQKAQASLSQFM